MLNVKCHKCFMANKPHTCDAVLSANQHIPNARRSLSDNPLYFSLFNLVCSGRVKFYDFLRVLRLKACTLSEEVSYPNNLFSSL